MLQAELMFDFYTYFNASDVAVYFCPTTSSIAQRSTRISSAPLNPDTDVLISIDDSLRQTQENTIITVKAPRSIRHVVIAETCLQKW